MKSGRRAFRGSRLEERFFLLGQERPEIDALERRRMLDQILTDLLARASSYGFSVGDVLAGLRRRKEERT